MIPIFAIKAETARHYGVAPGEIDGRDRTAQVAFPRNVAMTIARNLTGYSFPELGRQFGGRDHTTIQRNVKLIKHMAKCRPEVRESLNEITARLVSDHMPVFKSTRTQRSAEQ